MPKARRSSYTMAFRIKVIAEAEAVKNSSEIARDYGLSESMVRRWRREVSRTRRASDGVTFTAERPNISLVMCDEESFCRVE